MLTLADDKQRAHDSFVTSVSFNGDGTRIVSGGCDKAIKLWGAREWLWLRGRASEGYGDMDGAGGWDGAD